MKTWRPRAVELLRSLLVASVAIPAVLLGLLGWFTYRDAFVDAKHELVWTTEVAREHAAKVFDSYQLVADRVADLTGARDAVNNAAAASRLSRQIKAVVAGLPQIESLIVLDRTGHLAVATDADPVDRSLDFSDRDYFKAVRDGGSTSYVSRVQTSRITGKTFFGWARARQDAAGAFDGLVDIAVSPDFLRDFYRTLVREIGQSPEGRVVTLVRQDGQVLVRYPVAAGPLPVMPGDHPFFAAIRADPDGGIYRARSLVEAGGPWRMFAYRKVPGHPVYIVAGRSVGAIQAEWGLTMLRYLAIGAAGTAALFLVTLTTLRGARRERNALAQVRAEMARREQAEDQLRQAQKMEAVGRLTGGIAHDFNNLLTVIRSSVDLLRSPRLVETRRERYVAAIADAADRAARLTAQLLAFARRQALKPEVFDVVSNVTAVVAMVRTLIGPRISVESHLPDGPVFADADPNQFDTCIVNLAVNARDAMGGEGHLTVAVAAVAELPARPGRAAVPGRHIAIAVSDTGAGIAPDRLDVVFEPFFTTKPTGEGTGLGLSQVFGFAKQSGGDVTVDSELGRGTTFTIFLPCASGPATRPDPGPERSDTREPRASRALVVEDDPSVGAAVTDALGELGYTSVLTTSAREALAALAGGAGGFAVVFSDVVMPGMSGIELGREIRKRHVDLPVVLTSGYSEVLAQDGAHGFELLGKPYSLEQLARALDTAARWRNRRQSFQVLAEAPAPGGPGRG